MFVEVRIFINIHLKNENYAEIYATRQNINLT